ncbi:unnamed protein product [Auanema sp. JU1783]|nr:unnamed protein product [Auanema sp. JU1783]
MENEGFSGVVRISNISDFIAPNLNCIIPLETTKTEVKSESLVGIRKKTDTEGKPKEKKTIKISLNDCLACNGCITTAETVLVEEQSLTKVLETVKDFQLCIATVCPQTVSSIAVKRQLEPSQVAMMISAYFFNLGFKYVLDSSFGRLFAHKALREEFSKSTTRPMLSSACPGFVCYAEKTHGNLLTPLISKVRSPQAIQGALVKDFLSRKLKVAPENIYHVTVMPCFDKKLEASRADFNVPGTSCRETDCVLSTAELENALPAEFDPVTTTDEGWLGAFPSGHLVSSYGGTSGGYSELIIDSFANKCTGPIKETLVMKNLRVFEIPVEEKKIQVAQCYGFRNIQNVVRKLKTGKCPYDFIEVMACPSGCGNGGGQIRAETAEERELLLRKVEGAYSSIKDDFDFNYENTIAEWSELNPNYEQLLYTDYHIIDANITQKLEW